MAVVSRAVSVAVTTAARLLVAVQEGHAALRAEQVVGPAESSELEVGSGDPRVEAGPADMAASDGQLELSE